MKADLLLTGGRIFLGLAEGSSDALAIRAGRVIAAGDDARAAAGPGTRRLELAGRLAVPAFNDCHMHLMSVGLGMAAINLRPESGARSIDEVLARVRRAAAAKAPGEWVLGRGYDHAELSEDRHPTARELDQAAPDNPVWLVRTCGHVAVANTRALQAAGIGHNTPAPPGGLIERRGNELTGMLAEQALRLVQAVLPEASDADMVEAVERAGRHMLEQGVASVMDANVGARRGLAEIHAYEAAKAAHRLPVRTYVCLFGHPAPEGIVREAHRAGYTHLSGDDRLRIGPVKVFADGSAGGRTAAMSAPYLGGSDTGVFVWDEPTMHALLAEHHALGYQLAIHAIGDAAIEQVLSGMEKAGAIPANRHRIEHCGFLTQGQRARMKARGILPVPQPVFIYEFGDLYIKVCGRERAEASYPMRSWIEEGHFPGASSDAPVSTTDPCKNLFTMVTRKTNKGTVLGAGQALSLDQAIHALTFNGAYVSKCEDRKGRLLPGMLADITVLSCDPFADGIEALEHATRADLTIVDGKAGFDRHGELA
ncbi:MAG: amidohydrolase [Acetobacteraceae bacterium]|nr:amidohydrolase [Acetobacteraceae bacterium]